MANQKNRTTNGILKFIPQSRNQGIVIQKNGIIRIKRKTKSNHKKTKKIGI